MGKTTWGFPSIKMKIPDGAAVPAIGDLAPNFALEDARGNPHRLSELTSRGLLVLIFYRGHW